MLCTIYRLLWSCLQCYCTIEMKTKSMIEAKTQTWQFVHPLLMPQWSISKQNMAFLPLIDKFNHHVPGLRFNHLIFQNLSCLKPHSSQIEMPSWNTSTNSWNDQVKITRFHLQYTASERKAKVPSQRTYLKMFHSTSMNSVWCNKRCSKVGRSSQAMHTGCSSP